MFSHSQEQKKQIWSEAKTKLSLFQEYNEIAKKKLFQLYKVRQLFTKLDYFIYFSSTTINPRKKVLSFIDNIHRIFQGKITDEQKSEQKDFLLIKTQQVQSDYQIKELHEQQQIEKALNLLQISSRQCDFTINIYRRDIQRQMNIISFYRRQLLEQDYKHQPFDKGFFDKLHYCFARLDTRQYEQCWESYQCQLNLMKATIQAHQLEKEKEKMMENNQGSDHRLQHTV